MSAGATGEFVIQDAAEFRKIVPAGARLEKLAGGFQFVEGPVWTNAEGGYLVFSDIPANELKKWTPQDGVSTFRSPSHNANGNTRDAQGRLITCEHSGRRVSIADAAGNVSTLVDRYQGKRLNSPNDVVVKSDGTIWFTDPPYGLRNHMQGKELDGNYVFRFDPDSGELQPVVDDFDRPNGLCFSPDESKLYIADSGQPRHVRVFDVQADGTLSGGSVFCAVDTGVPDGIRCDVEGRLYSSAGDGIQIFAPSGGLIGKILVPRVPSRNDAAQLAPESPANLCFGGQDGKTLFITASTSLYAIQLGVSGAGLRWLT